MNLRKRASVIIIVFAVLFALLAYRQHQSTRARAQLLEFRSSIALGMNQAGVERLLNSGRYEALELLRASPTEWIVTTPLELGARNWCIRLMFVDQAISAFGVRTPDNGYERPSDAPTDMGSLEQLK